MAQGVNRLALGLLFTLAGCIGEIEEMPQPPDASAGVAKDDAGTGTGMNGDAGTAPSPDAGPTDAGTSTPFDAGAMTPPDAGHADGGITPGRVPMFLLQGHLARTAVSCDLGQTWVADRSDARSVDRCWSPPLDGGVEIECDHQPTAGRGVAFGNGWFVANFGWGPTGDVRRSSNGVDWQAVNTGSNYASMVYLGGDFFGTIETPDVSRDDGHSWTHAGAPANAWGQGNVRRGGGGLLDGGAVLVMSADNGIFVGHADAGVVSWATPTVDTGCRAGQTEGGVAVERGHVVLLSETGVACTSTDGVTFSTHSVGGTVSSTLVFDGTRFVAWGQDTGGTRLVYRSEDGASWTATPTSAHKANGAATTADIGPAAFGEGTFVAVNGGWGQWYEQQRFFRSTDGVTWSELPAGAFTGGHPVRNMTFGYGVRSALCP